MTIISAGERIESLRKRLEDFFFFHLGSDAEWEAKETSTGFFVSVRHHRVEPFCFEWSREQIVADLSQPGLFEERLLTLLNGHRR